MNSNPEPRWQTPLPSTVVGSWGPYVTEYAQRELGITLDLWARRAINRALATDEAGKLVHRLYLISVGRQSGKTTLVRMVIEWALTSAFGPDWRLILGLAHDRTQARIPYTGVLEDLAAIKRRSKGGLALTRYLGIRSDLHGRHREYHTASREAKDSIRSYSVDLGVFDEIRTQKDYGTWAALEPTTRARPDPLILGISSAGDDRSVLLRDWFDRGVRIIDGVEPFGGFGMTWYAAPDDLAPDDPAAILAANPAIAEGRIPFGPVADSIYSLTPRTYRQETLNLWSEGADEWLPPGTWAQREGPQPPRGMRVVLAAENVPSWARATVSVCIVTDAGQWVGVAGEIDASRGTSPSVAPRELAAMVQELIPKWRPDVIAYSASVAAAPHLKAAADLARIPSVELGPRQIRAASALFRSELIGSRLAHGPDNLLTQQVRVARPSGPIDDGGDWFFSVTESLGEIDALRSCAWAHWAAIAPEARIVPPQIFV